MMMMIVIVIVIVLISFRGMRMFLFFHVVTPLQFKGAVRNKGAVLMPGGIVNSGKILPLSLEQYLLQGLCQSHRLEKYRH